MDSWTAPHSFPRYFLVKWTVSEYSYRCRRLAARKVLEIAIEARGDGWLVLPRPKKATKSL